MKVLVIGRLATLPFVEHELVTFDYIELDDASPA